MFSVLIKAQVALILFLGFANAKLTPEVHRRASVCNGQASFCDRSYGNITFVGTHDSYAIGATDGLFFNQDQNITQQLNDGVRLLQVQVHNKGGTLELCHTSCGFLDGGSLQNYLTTVKNWLNANPNEVVSLLMVNIDDVQMTNFGTVFKAAGVDTLSYSPSADTIKNTNWPTLGSLIDSGKRLVTFVDAEANFQQVPYIISEFLNIWETAYDVTDTTFDCNVNRTKGDTSTQMYLINHFLDQLVLGAPAPDKAHANTTNAATGTGSVGAQISTCVSQHGRAPNFILVDWYEFGGGGVFQAAATANGVQYNPSTPIATPASPSASSSSGSASGTSSGGSPSSTSRSGAGYSTTASWLFIAASFICATLTSGGV